MPFLIPLAIKNLRKQLFLAEAVVSRYGWSPE